MKRTLIAAATLLLGTTALTAASAAQDKFEKGVKIDSKLLKAATMPKDRHDSIKLAQASAMKTDIAYSGMGGPLESVGSETKMAIKSDTDVEKGLVLLAKDEKAPTMKSQASAGMDDPAEEFSSISDKTGFAKASDPAVLGKPEQATAAVKNELASGGTGRPSELLSSLVDKPVVGTASDPASLDKHEQAAAMKLGQAGMAMGGPIEGANTVDLTPRPATDNYPPCDPGPGDDRCIQSYEAGVIAARN
ncbi:MAG: hypothetical protein ACXW2T_03680 [Allosphingosinicella sp.]